MPSEPGSGAAPVRRLHPASLIFSLGSAARKLLLPGLLVLFAARGGNTEFWLMIVFFPAAVAALIKYVSFRYRLGAEEMVIREGIVTRNERHIPYARIQNINLIQNPLHRWLGVAEVRLQTAGGEKPEAVMRVISLREIERLRRQVREARGETSAIAQVGEAGMPVGAPAETASRLLQLSPRELVLFGLISNRGMAVVVAAMGVAWQFDLFDANEAAQGLSRYKVYLPDSLATPRLLTTIVLAVAGLIVALVALRALSVTWALVKFHGFVLARRGGDLLAQYGLFTRISATIPLHRIQLLSTRSTPLHRWCDRSAVQAETAGGGAQSDESVTHRLWLAPLIRGDRAADLLAELLPDVEWGNLPWQALPHRAGRRVLRRSLALLIVVLAIAVVAFGPLALLLALPGVPWVWLHARLYLRHTAYAVTPTAVLYRSGWWLRQMSVVRFSKIQTVALQESPFDRRNGMASLKVDTAGAGRVGHRIDIDFLELAAARVMAGWLNDEASRTRFRW